MSGTYSIGDVVVMPSLPEWVERLEPESRRVFEYCVGRPYRIVEIDDNGHLVLDVSPDVDALLGGYMNDIRVEPELVRPASEVERRQAPQSTA
jgi:hypothetical protein